ncbi:MAG: hypothetical protein Q8L44_07910 [Sulfuritalea sp.]|nr:hypothetical protein [Sulfuritalea sp.]
MISDETKAAIDGLPMEELLHEVIRGNRSRFQGEGHDYLVAQYALMKQREQDRVKEKELTLAEEANNIAKAASVTAVSAYRMSYISVVVAIVALLGTVLQQCSRVP